MRIDIITVLPELLRGPFDDSIIRRARSKGIAEINVVNLRDYSTDRHKSVDDYPFGGGAGMVMMIEPVYNCITHLTAQRRYDEIIYTSPDGVSFSQSVANELSMKENIIILAGHYKGIDQRIRDHLITREVSIGDYVLTGGELPAAVITDAPDRLTLKGGKYLTYYSEETPKRLKNGVLSNRCASQERKDPASWERKHDAFLSFCRKSFVKLRPRKY